MQIYRNLIFHVFELSACVRDGFFRMPQHSAAADAAIDRATITREKVSALDTTELCWEICASFADISAKKGPESIENIIRHNAAAAIRI